MNKQVSDTKVSVALTSCRQMKIDVTIISKENMQIYMEQIVNNEQYTQAKYTKLCALFTIHIVHAVYTKHSAHYTLHILHCTQYQYTIPVHSTQYTVHSTQYTVHCIHSIQYTLQTIPYKQYTIHSTHNTQHYTQYLIMRLDERAGMCSSRVLIVSTVL